MKKFLAIYMGSKSSDNMDHWNALSEDARKQRQGEGMKAWMAWGEKNGKAIRDHGGPLGKTKKADASGISDIKNLMTGYTIIEAESHEAAAQMFRDHPHFSVFPGESVEIMECMPMPGIGQRVSPDVDRK